ncbi:MAG TPA: histidinol-phosphate transaminase [Egibacteraceae bacterium]|nr:histidinol-phosphate transaminase [Egibacteraceae bacterium]
MSDNPSPDRVPVRDDLEGVTPYGAPQLDVPVRLNTNETPYPVPDHYAQQLAKAIAALGLNRYPDRRAAALRTALGGRFGLPAERVWAANGSNEILVQLFQAYGGPGRQLLLFRPGYSAHPLLARVAVTESVEADLDADLRLTPELALEAVERHKPDLICIASPNNPTGIPVPLESVRALHDSSRALVIVDEAYVEFGGDSAAELLDELPRLAITRTFSKAWRLAGLRLGYLLAHAWVIEDLRKVRLPYHLDAITQEAGLLAVELASEVTAHVADVVAERDRLRGALVAIDGVSVFDSAANFLLFSTQVPDLFDRLLARGVLVRDFSQLPRLEGCLRVTVGSAEENDRFLAAMKECMQ